MTSQAESLVLADRVEALDGQDREVDAQIMCALNGYTMHEESSPASGSFAFWEGYPWHSICHNCSSWAEPTASLNAAPSAAALRAHAEALK